MKIQAHQDLELDQDDTLLRGEWRKVGNFIIIVNALYTSPLLNFLV